MAGNPKNAPEREPEVLPPVSDVMALAQVTAGNGLAHRLPELSPDDPLYETAQAAHRYMEQAKSKATSRAYASDWRHFAEWCDR